MPRCDEPWVLLGEYNDLAYQDMLGSYKLFKVMKCRHLQEELVLVKLFILRDGSPDIKELKRRVLQVKDAFRSHWLYPNVVPYQALEVGVQSAILLRPHFARNLYDRMHSRPFLTEPAKNWIAFQVLCAVCQAHSVGVTHGDLKTENVFVSSWGHAVLSDFAIFKPLVLPKDDPSEFSFFFESNLNRRRCYLAPERFDGLGAGASSAALAGGGRRFTEELAAMDIFSLGCVIAELFLDGQTLMDLPELLRYRQGQLDLRAKIACIKNRAVQEIVGSMLERDPLRRGPASHYLRLWIQRLACRAFCSCLFPLSLLLLHPVYQQPDMRIILIRFNFASLVWSAVGPARIAASLGLAPGAEAAAVWAAWHRHAELHTQATDGASLQGMVQAAAQAAAQRWEASAASEEAAAAAVRQAAASMEEAPGEGATPPQEAAAGLAPRLAHPWLQEAPCEAFTRRLVELWDEGCKRRLGAEGVAAERPAGAAYAAFLAELCGGGGARRPDGATPGPPGPGPAGAAEGGPSGSPPPAAGAGEEDVLGILCGFICSAVQHLSNPRMRTMCLDMLEQLAAFAPQSAILEQIVPYGHALMTDPVAKVRARAIELITNVLGRVGELPPGDTPLFLEYLFPQVMSAMSNMSGEPVVLLAVARNIGALTQHALRFMELAVASARRGCGPSSGLAAGPAAGGPAAEQELPAPGAAVELPGTRRAGPDSAAAAAALASGAVEVESYDVQWRRIREAVKKVVKALIDPQSDSGSHGKVQAAEEPALSLASGREVKISLLRNMCVLAESFGKECTLSFLLPYLISFMNDPAWEVRAAFCEEAALLPRKVGKVSTEGIIWPCYEQALLDQEERVLEAALRGLALLVAQKVLNRQWLTKIVAAKVAAFLVHPSVVIRGRTVEVFQAIGSQMSAVELFAFVMPTVQPFLRVQGLGLDALDVALVQPVSRRAYKRVVLQRDKELHEALLHKRPLPLASQSEEGAATEGEAEGGGGQRGAADRAALELLREHLLLLLRARPTAGQLLGSGQREEEAGAGAGGATAALAKSLRYFAVNPRGVANQSLQALAEAEDGERPAWAAGAAQRGRAAAGHALGLFSTQAFLAQALRLPPWPRDLGCLSSLDGTPYSIYAAAAAVRAEAQEGPGARAEEAFFGLDGGSAGPRQPLDLCDSTTASTEALASSGVSERRGAGTASRRWSRSPDEMLGTSSVDAEDRIRASLHHAAWRPQGVLLATLYEYAHQSGVPVVKVDCTDDSRVLVTGGQDGVVKVWNCAHLERDVAVSSSHTFSVPCAGPARRQQLRALRTVRNSKAVAVGSEAGAVLLYRIDSRGSTSATEVCRLQSAGGAAGCAVMCLEQFDTELESTVVFAQASGAVRGWDIRRDSPSWSVQRVPPWLGVPSCLTLGSDGHTMVIGTLAGGLLVYDLRFLAPWKQWRIASGPAALCMRSANFRESPSVFVALDSDANEVALFDVVRGSCLTLFLTEPVAERQKEAAVSVPTLLPAQPHAGPGAAGLHPAVPAARRTAGSVRALWLPPRGAQTFLLAGGTDRKVRHWSLDPEHHAAEAYVVTPQDPLGQQEKVRDRTTYSSNHLGDVFVVQEQSPARSDAAPWGVGGGEGEEARPAGPNPNHRDAILDMCTISLQSDILVTAGRDGLVKLWK